MPPRRFATALSLSLGAAVALAVPAASILGAAGCQQLDNGSGGGGAAGDGGGVTPTAATAGTTLGGGCGIEASTGLQLCTAVSDCPSVVIDTGAMPNCGFRVRNGVSDLVCACGSAICPMGLFGSCDEAAKLLTTQTQANVCAQVAEGRCSAAAAAAAASATATATTPAPTATATATTTVTTPNPSCDRSCLADCGGGAACASVCNCN